MQKQPEKCKKKIYLKKLSDLQNITISLKCISFKDFNDTKVQKTLLKTNQYI